MMRHLSLLPVVLPALMLLVLVDAAVIASEEAAAAAAGPAAYLAVRPVAFQEVTVEPAAYQEVTVEPAAYQEAVGPAAHLALGVAGYKLEAVVLLEEVQQQLRLVFVVPLFERQPFVDHITLRAV
jgi:hypothetical protein